MAWWGEAIIYLLQMFEYLVNDCGPSLPFVSSIGPLGFVRSGVYEGDHRGQ